MSIPLEVLLVVVVVVVVVIIANVDCSISLLSPLILNILIISEKKELDAVSGLICCLGGVTGLNI